MMQMKPMQCERYDKKQWKLQMYETELIEQYVYWPES